MDQFLDAAKKVFGFVDDDYRSTRNAEYTWMYDDDLLVVSFGARGYFCTLIDSPEAEPYTFSSLVHESTKHPHRTYPYGTMTEKEFRMLAAYDKLTGGRFSASLDTPSKEEYTRERKPE